MLLFYSVVKNRILIYIILKFGLDLIGNKDVLTDRCFAKCRNLNASISFLSSIFIPLGSSPVSLRLSFCYTILHCLAVALVVLSAGRKMKIRNINQLTNKNTIRYEPNMICTIQKVNVK